MKYMKYNLVFAIAALLWTPTVWAAPGDLIVEFQATPLFNEANFLPGSEVGRWAKVKNNTGESKNIIVEAINDIDPDGLASVFEIGIYEGGIQRYGTTTLAAFFAAGEVSLSNLAGAGAQTQYDFLVRFVPTANNPYQEKSVGFDILIGFKGDEGSGGSDDEGTFTTTPPSGGGGGDGGGGGGGGGNGPPSGLVISDGGDVVVGETTATISWLTSFLSTSRVIYGITPGVFNFSSPPNYGYLFSTDESNTPVQPNGVTFHTVVLAGLVPGTTYYYRVISHASPDTISFERSVTTRGKASSEGAGALAFGGSGEVLGASSTMSGGGPDDIAQAGLGSGDAPQGGIEEHGEDAAGEERRQEVGSSASQVEETAALIFGIGRRNWILILGLAAVLFGIFIATRRYWRRQ